VLSECVALETAQCVDGEPARRRALAQLRDERVDALREAISRAGARREMSQYAHQSALAR
jgi:hypothetical protein